MRPVLPQYCPIGHGRHADAFCPPDDGLYVPGGHNVTVLDPAVQYLPGGHVVGAMVPCPGQYVPLGQLRQLICPCSGWYVPGSQNCGAENPDSVKEPLGAMNCRGVDELVVQK
jgi:hypothetical protein